MVSAPFQFITVQKPKVGLFLESRPATHRSGGIGKVDFEASHSSDDGDDGLDGVAVDYGLVLLTLLL